MTPREAFAEQAEACRTLGSPFMDRLLRLCAERLDRITAVGRTVLDWPGNPHYSADSVPLRLAGGLHRLVLDGSSAALAACYPPARTDDDALWAAIAQAFRDHEAALLTALKSPPQTNEIRRSVALIPALHLIAGETGLPLRLSELGASARLNLLCDRFRLWAGKVAYGPAGAPVTVRPDWTGPPPAPAALSVIDRAGVDLNPVDLGDPGQQLRLLSYLWPDQAGRMAMTRAAIGIARQAPPDLARADAIDWLETRLESPERGTAHVVYNTVAWQYFAPDSQARGNALLERAGAAATRDHAIAHLAMEGDGGRGAALTLRLWPGGRTRQLARVDFHGRWIEWSMS